MAKIYTAQELREEAELEERDYGEGYYAAAMLHQAADLMEREEKKEKKYEYATILSNGGPSHIHDDKLQPGYHYFRRPVGEWEEVKV